VGLSSEEIHSLWSEYAPLISEAQERDAQDKHEHFLKWYVEEINGIPAKQLTLELYLLLSVSNSLINEDEPTSLSVLRFLWIVSPNFKESKIAFRLFQFRHRKIDFEKTLEEIGKYLNRSFHASVGGKAKDKEEKKVAQEWISSMVDLIGSEYGWQLDQIMEMPLTLLFMQCARIRARMTGKPVVFSQEADALKAEYLQRANQERAS